MRRDEPEKCVTVDLRPQAEAQGKPRVPSVYQSAAQMTRRPLDPAAFIRDGKAAIADIQAAMRDYAALHSVGYVPLQSQGLEKARRGISGSGGGLDRVKAAKDPRGDPRDFDGLEALRARLGDSSHAVAEAAKFAARAKHDLGALQSLIDKRRRPVDDTKAIERPPKPCSTCEGKKTVPAGRKVRACPTCGGSGFQPIPVWERPMDPEEAQALQAKRVRRMEDRLDAGVPVDVAMSEVW